MLTVLTTVWLNIRTTLSIKGLLERIQKVLTNLRLVDASDGKVAISAMSPLPISCQVHVDSTGIVQTPQETEIKHVDNGEI